VFDYSQLVALVQVIFIDIVLAATTRWWSAWRRHESIRAGAKMIMWGVGARSCSRLPFALVATQLLAIVGLALAGGILLLWVCWKMYRDIVVHQPLEAFVGGARAAAKPSRSRPR